jgi:hypothetical protein
MVALGLAMWGIYGLVNVEERYVTLAYLVVVLPVFAALRVPVGREGLRPAAAILVAAVAFLALGETLRVALEARRDSGSLPQPWYSREIFRAAKGLAAMGVQPGDEIACIGTTACLHDPYWQRLAGVRVLTEVYNPKDEHLMLQLQGLTNRQQMYDVVKAEGAKVLVASFDPGEMTASAKASAGWDEREWERLGETHFYALRLNLPAQGSKAATEMPWTPKVEVAP